MTTMPPRISLWFALVAGLVAGATAVTEGRTWWLVALAVVGFGGSSGLITRRPWIGVAIMAAVVLGLGVLGMGADSSAVPLMPLILGVVAAGYLVPAPVSVLGPLALAGASLAFGPWDHGTVIFAFVLFLLPWGFGTVVRGRDVRRRSAEVEALRLALVDPTTRAESAAVLDREQYAASALTVVDAAVERMNRAAASAKESLDATAIETVRQAGTEATTPSRICSWCYGIRRARRRRRPTHPWLTQAARLAYAESCSRRFPSWWSPSCGGFPPG